jgi:hypothetical protein
MRFSSANRARCQEQLMDFVTAEEKFNELQARIRRGEPMSEDQYQEELAKLMVQDESGVFWSLEPGTGRWLYFNGTEWVPGMPPKQAAPPMMPGVPPAADTASTYEPPLYQAPPSYEAPPGFEQPTTEAPSYYVPSDVTRPVEYSGTYTGAAYGEETTSAPGYVPLGGSVPPEEPGAMPTYVRMPEPDTTGVSGGGIPPRPVREASPLAVPGGERAWLPFAFGALVLLLCAVVLFFGVRGSPFFTGGTANTQATDEPTEEVTDVLPTETVIIEPTDEPQPTNEPTAEPQATPAPQPVTAAATDVLNIRQGPARTTPSLGKLQPQQQVTVVGRNGDATWLEIQIPENVGTGTGWVSAEFVTVNGDVNTLPVTSGDSGGNPQPTETPTG